MNVHDEIDHMSHRRAKALNSGMHKYSLIYRLTICYHHKNDGVVMHVIEFEADLANGVISVLDADKHICQSPSLNTISINLK